jgi:hypothetical protein
LLAIALLPTLVILPVLLAITMARWEAKFDALLTSKVNGDLTIAHQYLSRILENTGEHLKALTDSAGFRDIVVRDGTSALPAFLEENRKRLGLDFLMVIGSGGPFSASPPLGAAAPIRSDWPVVQAALSGRASAAIDIFTNEELAAISSNLASQARLELVPTPNALPTDRTIENRGMVVHSASPAFVPGRGTVALVGGILLNQNLVFIDTINDLVYREASLPAGSRGTATLFLDDVRISTNVRLFENKRALGTRVSKAVPPARYSTRVGSGSIAPSSSTTGMSPPTSRSATATASGSACSMSASWRRPSPAPRRRP